MAGSPIAADERLEPREEILRFALVGTHRDLYLTNVTFHTAIDAILPLILMWVDAVAAKSVDQQESLEARIRAMSSPVAFSETAIELLDSFRNRPTDTEVSDG